MILPRDRDANLTFIRKCPYHSFFSPWELPGEKLPGIFEVGGNYPGLLKFTRDFGKHTILPFHTFFVLVGGFGWGNLGPVGPRKFLGFGDHFAYARENPVNY